jgi:transcriptional regulator of heat shock response
MTNFGGKMTPRREAILDAIIREYVETAEPVGSLTLVDKFDFPFSPATIRAEMAWLEEDGYIYQPHTSAGRVPTEKGYRHFVNLVLSESQQLVAQNEVQLQRRILNQHMKYEKLLDMAAKSLADMTGNVGIVGVSGLIYSHGLTNLFSQPEFLLPENVVRASEILDRMHELVAEIPDMRNPLVYIGSESPIGKAAGCSLVVSGFETPYMTDGRLAVLGPTRMSYPNVISIVEEVKDLLESWRK